MTSGSRAGHKRRPTDGAMPHRVVPRSSSLLDSIDGIEASFHEAVARADLVTSDLLVAGHRVHLQFAGSALTSAMEPAFDHLVAHDDGQDRPDLTVHLWDAASTGVRHVPMPPGVLQRRENGPRYHGEHDGIIVHAAEATLSVVNAGGTNAMHYVPDANDVLWYQKAAPLRDVVHAWAGRHDFELLHGAAVGHPDGGVLIAGKAGSGKSTTSLACLRAGLGYAGDDYVLVDIDRPFVHSLYSSAKLEWSNLDRHPGLLRPVNSRADPKAVAFLARDVPERVVRGFPLLALLLPTITGRVETRAVETTAARGLLGLAPSTVLQMRGQGQPVLGAMSQLVERMPVFRLELGTNLSRIPEVVDGLINELRDR
jgi:hypothetical protein